MNDLQKTQHYTNNSQYICENLIQFLPEKGQLIEPFVGQGDLLKIIPNRSIETYDIDFKSIAETIQDTLKFPPNYKNKWVITNPPYLAKNKSINKEIYQQWNEDDLYKIFIKTLIPDIEGGIIIIPVNFFTDENTANLRTHFLQFYQIDHLNIFFQPVFGSTTYNVCSFAFHKAIEGFTQIQNIPITIFPQGEEKILTLEKEFNYRIGGRDLSLVENVKSKFGRIVENRINLDYITNIKLIGLDTREEPFHLEYNEEIYYGKASDRIYATLTCKKFLTSAQQKRLIDDANEWLMSVRKKNYNLIFTNYRDFNRKRVGFDFIYKLLTVLLNQIE